MNKEKVELGVGMCVVILTKHIMKKEQLNQEGAYRRLIDSELYNLLNDEETGLFLEHDQYLCEAYDVECNKGKKGLYQYINKCSQ